MTPSLKWFKELPISDQVLIWSRILEVVEGGQIVLPEHRIKAIARQMEKAGALLEYKT